jgi:TonB family protein
LLFRAIYAQKENYMRRVIFATTLILFPVLASAQAGISTESKQYPDSAAQVAELNRPQGLAQLAMAAAALNSVKPEVKTATKAGPATAAAVAGSSALRETVQTRLVDSFTDTAFQQAGTLEFGMSATPVERSAPKVTRAAEVELSPSELAQVPAVSNVAVRAVVDENGVPRDVTITHSAGPVVDREAVAAVSQYRFKPATVDNRATPVSLSIAIKLEKQ